MLGPAAVRWNDYVGTAAADDANALPGAPSLYEVAGLDRENWFIVGVDLGVWEREPRVTVYAVDRTPGQAQTLADLDDLADVNGLPVTAFQISPSSRVEEFIEEAFQRIAIRWWLGHSRTTACSWARRALLIELRRDPQGRGAVRSAAS